MQQRVYRATESASIEEQRDHRGTETVMEQTLYRVTESVNIVQQRVSILCNRECGGTANQTLVF